LREDPMEREGASPIDAWPTTESAGVRYWNCRDTPAPAVRAPTAVWLQPPSQAAVEIAGPPELPETWLLRQQHFRAPWQQEHGAEARSTCAATGASGEIQRSRARHPATQRRTQPCNRSKRPKPHIPRLPRISRRNQCLQAGRSPRYSLLRFFSYAVNCRRYFSKPARPISP